MDTVKARRKRLGSQFHSEVQIPTESGHHFRLDAGHRSDLKPATRPQSEGRRRLRTERVTAPAGQHRPRVYSLDPTGGGQMPAQRLSMRRVRELLRLHYGAGASARAIARELGVVKEYLARAVAAELAWPLPAELTDAVLEEQLFAAGGPALRLAAGYGGTSGLGSSLIARPQ